MIINGSKIAIEKITPRQDKVRFDQLSPGDWYESESCYGLCMKLDASNFWCFDKKDVFEGLRSWPCRVVNVNIKYRVA